MSRIFEKLELVEDRKYYMSSGTVLTIPSCTELSDGGFETHALKTQLDEMIILHNDKIEACVITYHEDSITD